jgi:hypothetical protein
MSSSTTHGTGPLNTVDCYVPYVCSSRQRSACETWLEQQVCADAKQALERGFLQRVLLPQLL